MQDFIEQKTRPEIFKLKPYVPGKPAEEVKRELGLDDIIKLASNENPLGASPLAVKAIEDSLQKLHIYPDSNCFYLKEKIATKFNINSDQIIIGNGSDELLMLIACTFVSSEDEVIFANPSFAEYEFTSQIMGANIKSIPLKEDFSYDIPAMLAAVNEKTKIVYICNPNNPTGNIVTEKQLDDFIDMIPDNVLVIIDEAYYEYADNSDYVTGLKYIGKDKNVIVLRTFSKIYGLAALRVGYGISTSKIIETIHKTKEPFNVNMLAQVAANAAMDDIDHVQKSHAVNLQGKNYFYTEFEKMGLKYVPTEANFIFVDTGKDCMQVFKELLSLGIIIRTGNIFGFPTYIRITIGTPEENERLILGLRKVLAG